MSERRVLLSEIQARVTRFYGLAPTDLVSNQRARSVARPRQVAMYLARHLTALSMTQIGNRFNRDHTTVLHAVQRVDQLRTTDTEVARQVSYLLGEFGG